MYFEDDRTQFIKRNFDSQVLNAYLKINESFSVARADLFRYLVIYREGGVYLDIKSQVREPLTQVLDPSATYILSTWNDSHISDFQHWGEHKELSGREFQIWHLIAAPEHPFLKAVIEQVVANINNYSSLNGTHPAKSVLSITGPIAYTTAIEPILQKHAHTLLQVNDLGLFHTIYENPSQHTVSPRHYSKIWEPVVIREGLKGNLDTLVIKINREIIRLRERYRYFLR